jgi:Fe-S cluster biogenesis protein NfuA
MDIKPAPNPITLKFMPQNFYTNQIGEFFENSISNPILANELLKITGVKSVSIGARFISVSRKTEFEWDEIRINVITVINDYKDELQIDEHAEIQQKVLKLQMEIIQTPNPITLKFVPQNFYTTQVGEFSDINTEYSMLVNELLKLEGVKYVFIGKKFISVSRKTDFEWEEIKEDIIQVINTYKDAIQGDETTDTDQPTLHHSSATGDATIESKIREVLDSKIRPAVEMDGGDVEFIAFDKISGTVYVTLKGACVGCPSSQATLQNGISNTLMYYIPEVKSIAQV